MKRWIHASTEQHKQIVITMCIEEVAQDVAASEYMTHPKNIKKSKRITDNYLDYLNEIIETFDANIQIAGFEITNRKQAKNSYSYYITFIPITEDGERLMPVDLVFRISNHNNKYADYTEHSNFVRIIKFTLDNEDFDKASQLIYKGIYIIQELKKGNVDVLD